MILLLADGVSYQKIQDLLDTTAPTIARWKSRFLQHRISGLTEELHPGQPPSVRTPKLQAKVLAAIKEGPKDGSTGWSCRNWRAAFMSVKTPSNGFWRKLMYAHIDSSATWLLDDPDFETMAAGPDRIVLDSTAAHCRVLCG
jgi:hypothetical protein